MRMEEGLGELYLRIGRQLRSGWGEELEQFSLSPHQARAIRVIGDTEVSRLREVAERLRIAPRSVTDVVDALEEKGLVERFGDPDDRRAVCVRLSSRGQDLQERLRRHRRATLDSGFDRLDASEQEQLRRLLVKLDRAEGES